MNSVEDSKSFTTERIRINYASQKELETLPGIGPAKAATIIQHRKENGHFKTLDALVQIPGIGEKTLQKLQPFIVVP